MIETAQNDVYLREEMANPPGMKVSTADRHELRLRLHAFSYSVFCAIAAARIFSE